MAVELKVKMRIVKKPQSHAVGRGRAAPLMRGVMMIMNRFLIAALATIWTVICLADGDPRPINIAKCLENNCTAQDVHVFTPEENFKVQAWFDVVSFPDKPTPYFYPLFNVFNFSNNEAELVVGMQLIDQEGKVLLEATDKAVFKPTEKTEGSYETYFSVNAKPVSTEIANLTKFLRVVYRR